MLNFRQKEMERYLSVEQTAKVEQLAQHFQVSIETIRRDIKVLEKEAALKRVHGGVVYNNLRAREVQYEQRVKKNYKEKVAIARLAASFVEDGDTVAINTGTSTLEVAKCIQKKNDLTIVTNSLDIAALLVQNESNHIYLLGGELRKAGLGVSGPFTQEMLDQFCIDKTILSVGGIAIDQGITEYHTNESFVIKAMHKKANKTMVVCDYSKFNVTAMNCICGLKDIDYLITDWNTQTKDVIALRSLGVKTYVAAYPRDI